MSDNSSMGDQAISKMAEVGLKTQLDEFDELKVVVQTSPQALVGGEIDSVTIDGRGLAMRKDELRTEKLHIETGAIAINPWKAAFGNIELKQTVEAKADVTLTEQDINCAFNSDYLQSKFQDLSVQIEGYTATLKPGHIEFRLPGGGKVRLQADVELVEVNQACHVSFTAVPTVSPDGQRIVLKQIEYEAGAAASEELTAILIDSASEMLDMRNFELEGMRLKIRDLAVVIGRLEIKTDVQVEEFPGNASD
ncbi:MAG: DUF2993 domain-containing protein [Cyanobacteria bacterium J06626_14]